MRTKFAISQSALGIYRNCPYAYKLKYINKCKQAFFDQSILDVGNYVHQAIDKYYKNDFLLKATAEEILVESYNELKKVWDISLSPKQLLQAYTCLENHAQWEADNLVKYIRTKPFTEQKLKERDYYGIIDYVDLPNLQVIDWKTGRKPYLTKNYRIQAYIYKELFEARFNQKLPYFLFYFVQPDQWRKVDFSTAKQKKIAIETEDMKRKLMDDIESGNFEKKPSSPNMCKYCDLNYYCLVQRL